MSLFQRFSETKEQGFRDEFILPFLIRLGFIGITNKHGSQEFGKDFVFSELDRFGHLRHMVVQAKHEESIGQGAKVDGLLSQVRQAFNVPFTLPSSPAEERFVSAVYVFNSGSISENAIVQIRRGLAKEHATNAHFFDGEQLAAIAATTAMAQDQFLRSRLSGLIHQLQLNCVIWERLRKGVTAEPPIWDVREGIIHGLEEYISCPLLIGRRDIVGDVTMLWQNAKIIRGIIARQALHFSQVGLKEQKQQDIAMLSDTCAKGITQAEALSLKLLQALNALPAATI